MIDAKNEDGKFSFPITLYNKKKRITLDFYIDTGFHGYLKIDKKIFDELGLEKIKDEQVSTATGSTDTADIAVVNYEIDRAQGLIEIMAVGWGGRNLLGVKFLRNGNFIVVIDNTHGIHLTSDRNLAYEIGKTIYEYYKKPSKQ